MFKSRLEAMGEGGSSIEHLVVEIVASVVGISIEVHGVLVATAVLTSLWLGANRSHSIRRGKCVHWGRRRRRSCVLRASMVWCYLLCGQTELQGGDSIIH